MTEKSCGTILYTVINKKRLFVIVKTLNSNCYGFPKGHVEDGENEEETALRETLEETSIDAEIIYGFRRSINYTLPNGLHKTVVYFLAKYNGQTAYISHDYEIQEILILPFEEAYNLLSHNSLKRLLGEANDWINHYKR